MPNAFATASDSVLVVVDIQPGFMKWMEGVEPTIRRSEFMIRMAALLGIPILATEQYPERMGGTHPDLAPLLPEPPIGKTTFSCVGSGEFLARLKKARRPQVVLIGIETHICMTQTALHLRSLGYEVMAAVDTMAARTRDRHEIGLERLRSAGVTLAHSESIAYEWLLSAENPAFKDALKIVKEFAS